MASHGRRAAFLSLVLVCCLSSGVAAASPSQRSRPVQSGLWSQTVEVVIRAPAHWLRALREMFARSSELRSLRP